VAAARAAICDGVGAHLIEVQAHVANGLPKVTIIGMADPVVADAKDRVRSAFANSSLPWPDQRITIALSPAEQPKRGTELDLAIAVAVLTASGELPAAASADATFVGEVGLDGKLRRGRRAFALAGVLAKDRPSALVFVPASDIDRWGLVPGIRPVPVAGLRELIDVLRGERRASTAMPIALPAAPDPFEELSDVTGQPLACQALEVAAVGGHHLLLSGPPGIGKTMLCRRFPGILPDMSMNETLAVAAIREVCAGSGAALSPRPPFQSPHHTCSHIGLVGGGSHTQIRPGLVTQAHNGVLFLDEAAEFRRKSIEALRQPLESGQVSITRSGLAETLPARFQLLMTQNPCPCGQADTPGGDCRCGPAMKQRYETRLSGPLLDRVDLRLRLRPPTGTVTADSTLAVRTRVGQARDRGHRRLKAAGYTRNVDVPARVLRKDWPLGANVQRYLDIELGSKGVSARSRDKALRVAWSIADLAGKDKPGVDDMAFAIRLRDAR
jgi:magnesium chelatase family protein